MTAANQTTCFCTLAIHEPYRRRARLLCADLASVPLVVLTDKPADFADLPVRAIQHSPTGPMAADFLGRLPPTGITHGAAAYHDKRFVVKAALNDFDTAIFLDADSRIVGVPPVAYFRPGLAVTPVFNHCIAAHLKIYGSWRLPAFEQLARDLTGTSEVLLTAKWCQESCFAVTKDGSEDCFFSAWERAAALLQELKVFSGEGGVMGLAAICAGWTVDFEALTPLAALIQHEGGGPKLSPVHPPPTSS